MKRWLKTHAPIEKNATGTHMAAVLTQQAAKNAKVSHTQSKRSKNLTQQVMTNEQASRSGLLSPDAAKAIGARAQMLATAASREDRASRRRGRLARDARTLAQQAMGQLPKEVVQ